MSIYKSLSPAEELNGGICFDRTLSERSIDNQLQLSLPCIVWSAA